MTDFPGNAKLSSLWDCLHDGTLESLKSDLLARTLTIVVDVLYHWEFHKLPLETRFRIVGENVRIAEVFDFHPWLGAAEAVPGTPWGKVHEQRRQDYEKGRMISADWNSFAANIETNKDYKKEYDIMKAELKMDKPLSVLKLGIINDASGEWRNIEIHAERFHFNVGEREVSLQEFQEFGSAYWQAFTLKSNTMPEQSEPGVATEKENNV